MITGIYQEDMDIEQALFNALYDLMMTTPIDKISVNDILKKASVSRASFYRRFKDKYDLLNRTYEDLLKKTLFRFREDLSWRESVYQIYAIIRDNHKFFANAFESNDVNCFRNYLFEQAFTLESETLRSYGVDPKDPYNYYRLIGYASGGVNITMKWVQNGADLSLEEIVNLLVEIVPVPFREYFK